MIENPRIRSVNKLLSLQLMLCLLIPLIIAGIWGKTSAISAGLAVLSAIIPSLLFAKKLFQHQGAKARKQIVKDLYLGEFLKILSSVIIFTLVFRVCAVSPLVFFVTYITMLMTHWLSFLMIDRNRLKSD